ncbi:TetR/AcrR family transcriptional regulator [Tritonibacter horizontis]|uniref:HTH-type transcriptional regulator LuxR n=1 Tax=Tritonibacter horizontis TaxID=1768241 RepID=A0A132BXT5_9RHOB|nr:TetR/AcrR family transcriptional regulator [Tritonibacter horizontis]KUP93203.1 HTH-type transcriptional regulator LuxR [Tritonibacter horizontis]
MEDDRPERTNRVETTRARRALLVETAITCFVDQGIARTGMRDIAKKAGVSVGNLYNHFPGRDDLIAEIAKIDAAGLSEVVAQIAECTDPQEAIDRFVKTYFAYCADPVSAVLTVEITSEALRNPAIEDLFSGNRAMLVETLAAAIAAQGQTKTPADVSAGLVLDTIEGFALRVGLTGKKPRKGETEALMSFVRHALTAEED